MAIAGCGAPAVALGLSDAAQAGVERPLWREGSGKPVVADGFDPRLSLAPLLEQIGPSVVSIRASGMSPDATPRKRNDPRRPPWLPDGFDMQGEPPPGMGSGFILTADGLVLTNQHVVAGRKNFEVKLADGRMFTAKLVGADAETDVAVLRLEKASKLPVATLGSSEKLRVGDWVVAIGSPFGLEQTATVGIVSAKSRGSLGLYQDSYVDFLQVDAQIAPGNSGGPLFNMNGEVIGINTAVGAFGGGPGFAVPIDQAKRVVPQLEQTGKVVRGWLGIAGRDIEPAVGQTPERGAVIGEVHHETPAARAGLRGGDRIVTLNGKDIANFDDLRGRIAELGPGQKARLEVMRDGKKLALTAELAARPSLDELARLRTGPGDSDAAPGRGLYGDGPPRLGVEVKPIADGLEIGRVARGSVGEELGLEPGDVLLEVNGTAVQQPQDVAKALAKDESRAAVKVRRKGGTHTAVIERR